MYTFDDEICRWAVFEVYAVTIVMNTDSFYRSILGTDINGGGAMHIIPG